MKTIEPSASFNESKNKIFSFFEPTMSEYFDVNSPEKLSQKGLDVAAEANLEMNKAFYSDVEVTSEPIYLRIAYISTIVLLLGTLASFYFINDLLINIIVATGAGFLATFAFAWVKFQPAQNAKFPLWIPWLLLLGTMGGMIALEMFKYPFFEPHIAALFNYLVDLGKMDSSMAGLIGLYALIFKFASVITIFIPGVMGLAINSHRVGSYVGILVGLTCYLGGKIALIYVPKLIFEFQGFLFIQFYTLVFLVPLIYGIVVTFIIKALNGPKKYY